MQQCTALFSCPERGDSICFNKKLTLLTLHYPPGSGGPEVAERSEVWADVSEPGTVTKLEVLAVGVDISLTAVMWRREYKDYTHAEYGGVRYKVASTGAAANPLHIKLSLERG